VDSLPYYYQAYGLTIASALECPQLLPGSGPADVTIRLGTVPADLSPGAMGGALYQSQGRQYLLRLEQIAGARFLVRDGREIVVDRVRETADETVRLFLLGSCMATLLYQRGVVPLHGSAVCLGESAVIVSGSSGTGKSTLAAALRQRGYTVLTDDLCAIRLEAGQAPLVFPGYPRLKLWADTLARLGEAPERLSRVRPELEKYSLPLNGAYAADPAPLSTVFVLKRSHRPAPELAEVTGVAKVQALQNNAYRAAYVGEAGLKGLLFRAATELARQVRVFRLVRPRYGYRLDELVDCLLRAGR
jgi:hypothetical protein